MPVRVRQILSNLNSVERQELKKLLPPKLKIPEEPDGVRYPAALLSQLAVASPGEQYGLLGFITEDLVAFPPMEITMSRLSTVAHARCPALTPELIAKVVKSKTTEPFLTHLRETSRKLRAAAGSLEELRHEETVGNDLLEGHPDYRTDTQVFEVKMTPEDAIDAQLAKIGLKPDDIKYVVVSHMHLDHGGNVGKFPNSTLIIQDDELSFAMFPDEPFAGGYIPGDAQVLRSPVGTSKPSLMDMVRLEGDYDLFGDGSVVICLPVAPAMSPLKATNLRLAGKALGSDNPAVSAFTVVVPPKSRQGFWL
jgi:hypothetical protein